MAFGLPDDVEWGTRVQLIPKSDVLEAATKLLTDYNKLTEKDEEVRLELITSIFQTIDPTVSKETGEFDTWSPLGKAFSNLGFDAKKQRDLLVDSLIKKWNKPYTGKLITADEFATMAGSLVPSEQLEWFKDTLRKAAEEEASPDTYGWDPKIHIMTACIGVHSTFLNMDGTVIDMTTVINRQVWPVRALAILVQYNRQDRIKKPATTKSRWATAKKVFGPADRGAPTPADATGAAKAVAAFQQIHGKTNTLQHYGDLSRDLAEEIRKVEGLKPDAKFEELAPHRPPISNNNYWLEMLDPKHRSWGHMVNKPGMSHTDGAALFAQWRDDKSTPLGFWQWLEFFGHADEPSVQYMAPDDRVRYAIRFEGNLLYWQGPVETAAKPFDTSGMPQQIAIWVCSPKGIFYSAEPKLNHLHHSSFLSGARALAGGQWKVTNGAINAITTKTGHYGTSPQQAYNALHILGRYVPLQGIPLKVFVDEPDEVWVDTHEFIQNSGEYTLCNRIKSPFQDRVGL